MSRLIEFWVYGGFLAGLLLIILSPLIVAGWPAAPAWAFAMLPAYMIHQFEEHDADRFRAYFNATLGSSFEVLTPLTVFITNVPGVWGVIALSLWLAKAAAGGWALIAVYLVLVNALVHIVHALLYRAYNPGLGTAVLVFLPLGGAALVQLWPGTTLPFTAVGVATAVAIHLAIVAHALHRKRALARMTEASGAGA